MEVVSEEAAIVQTVAEGYGTWRLSDAINALVLRRIAAQDFSQI